MLSLNYSAVLDGGVRSAAALMFVARATLILLVALGTARVLRRASAGSRHLVWLAALAMLVLLPALTAWSPLQWHILPAVPDLSSTVASIPPAPATAELGAAATRAEVTSPSSEVQNPRTGSGESRAAQEGIAAAAGRAAQLVRLNPFLALMSLWGLVVFALLVRLTNGMRQVRRIVASARALNDVEWRTPLLEISDRLELPEPPRLVMSESSRMPFACGLVHPTIVLPAEAATWSEERRLAVLLHELAHVRRRDLMGHTIGRVACAFYWFHPLVWVAAKRLRAESERACDDQAIACGTRASDYAEHLLDIVSGVRHESIPAVALAMAHRREFEGRMLAILDPALRRAAPSRRESAALVGLLGVLSLAIAAMAPAPPRDPVDRDNSTNSAQPTSDSAQPTVVVPGSRVEVGTRAEAPAPRPQRSAVMAPSPLAVLQSPLVAATDTSPESIAAAQQKLRDRASLLAGILRSDSSAELRRVAAWGLAQFDRSSIALEALSTALHRDASEAVREMAAWALGEASSRDAVPALTEALRNDASVHVRETAAWALGETSEEDAAPVLIAALRDKDTEVRQTAAWALGELGLDAAPKELIAALEDAEKNVRGMAAWALHQIGDAAAAPALVAAIRKEPDGQLRYTYIRAAGSLGESAADVIAELLDSPDKATRDMAIRSIAGAGSSPWPMPRPRPRPSP